MSLDNKTDLVTISFQGDTPLGGGEMASPPPPSLGDEQTLSALVEKTTSSEETEVEAIAAVAAMPGGRIEQRGRIILAKKIIPQVARMRVDETATRYFLLSAEKPKQLTPLFNKTKLKRAVYKKYEAEFRSMPDFGLVNDLINSYEMCGDSLDVEPAPFAFKSEDKYCFNKLDIDPTPGKHPAWEEFLIRLSSAEDFMAFVASIYESKHAGREFCYLYDPAGESGKSTVIEALCSPFGKRGVATINSHDIKTSSPHFLEHIYGKRLAVWPDCKNSKMPMLEIIRNLVSGERVTINPKGEKAFSVEVYVRLIVGANYAPEITGSGADASRLLRIDVASSLNNNDPTWKQRLIDELPFFLYACREVYKTKCPNFGKISLDDKTLDLIKKSHQDFEEGYEVALERLFVEVDPKGTVPARELEARYRDDLRWNSNQICDFKRFLERTHKVSTKRETVKSGGGKEKKITVYSGLRSTLSTRPVI